MQGNTAQYSSLRKVGGAMFLVVAVLIQAHIAPLPATISHLA